MFRGATELQPVRCNVRVLPLADSVAARQRPIVTQVIIGLCVLVFAYELTLRGVALDRFVETWGAVPQQVLAALAGSPLVARTEVLTLFTSLFIHAGFLHLGGNMLFLWVFGRAVEDRLGHPVYAVFYLVAGALAGLAQMVISGPTETVPLVGASGAIAAVLGVYFVSYPTAWVRVLLPVLFFFWTFDLPALLVLAFWFVTQFFTGVAAITHASRATDNVAIFAHVAGFLVGALAAKLLPAASVALPKGGAVGLTKRDAAPGPARLVSSVADLLALLLGARLVLRFLGVAIFAAPVVAVTEPIVDPLRGLLPTLRVAGGTFELYTLVAIVAVYLMAGLIGQLFLQTKR
jgi:membrane associated rhomboid family serine protease